MHTLIVIKDGEVHRVRVAQYVEWLDAIAEGRAMDFPSQQYFGTPQDVSNITPAAAKVTADVYRTMTRRRSK